MVDVLELLLMLLLLLMHHMLLLRLNSANMRLLLHQGQLLLLVSLLYKRIMSYATSATIQRNVACIVVLLRYRGVWLHGRFDRSLQEGGVRAIANIGAAEVILILGLMSWISDAGS